MGLTSFYILYLEPDISFKPHPPHEPSSEKNRRRIRVRSAGHELNSELVSCKTPNCLADSEESLEVSSHGRAQPSVSEDGRASRDICRDKIHGNKNGNLKKNNEMDIFEEKIPDCKDHIMRSKVELQKSHTRNSDNSHSSGFMETGVGPDVPEIQSPRKPSMMSNVCFSIF